jgi:BCD family chlorophyll transporter-like MFS transporter
MFLSALLFGWLLRDFTPLRLIRVIQSAAVVTLVLNVIALWKQEPRGTTRRDRPAAGITFTEAWTQLRRDPRTTRLLTAVALGTAGFTMQDILLEPFGGQILGLSVSATTGLTALLAGGMLVAFAISARRLGRGVDPHRVAALGALVGVVAFAMVAIVAIFKSMPAFAIGVFLIGVGGGLFAVGTLTAAMGLARAGNSGLALGAWGAVQATATGVAIAAGGALRDIVSELATSGALGPAMTGPATGYAVVYQLEVFLLFATLAVIGPLAAFTRPGAKSKSRFGLAEFPS